MIKFSPSKINIGLKIKNKRKDNYHNIETVFYPLPYYDIIEIVNSDSDKTELINKGLKVDCEDHENLCIIAYNKLKSKYDLPPIKIVLYKNIPYGTGLGAGSSNAASTIMAINEKYNLNISDDELINIASTIGADCAFFIKNKPVFAQGIGNEFKDINLDLSNYHIVICTPDINISTKDAYKSAVMSKASSGLEELVNMPIEEWQKHITNDFETTAFKAHPELANIKQSLLNNNALFAQMTGSGSAIYGIFKNKPENINISNLGKSNIKILNLQSKL